MISSQFLISNEPRYSFTRHLVFWLIWWIYFGFLHAANAFGGKEISYFNNLPFTILESILLLIPQIVVTYALLYFVLPRYLMKNRYFLTFVWIVVIWCVAATVNVYVVWYVNPKVLAMILPERFLRKTARDPNASLYMALLVLFKGGLVPAGIAVGIKSFKNLWLKEQRNLQLQKEKTQAQIQLLIAQVHPHFLFNTLNNIYSQTQTESIKGSKMILELSDLLRYIIYEGNKPLVPLEKELQMLKDYINLEKIRYDSKLDIHTDFSDRTEDIFISPLLLLPFIENSFKHGTSKILVRPWINLKVDLKDNFLTMKLMNGKLSHNTNEDTHHGIGIKNVFNRLELLYPGRHELIVTSDTDVFVIDLKVELIKLSKDQRKAETSSVPNTISYA